MMPRIAIALTLLLLLSTRVFADVTLSSPVDGYYRIGKYTPVKVTGVPPACDTLIAGDRVVSVLVQNGAGLGSIVVPLLPVTDAPGKLTVRCDEVTSPVMLPLLLLNENERLVGLIGAVSAADAQALFPGKTIVAVKLDAVTPLPGTPAAWEVLDAVVCDSVTSLPAGNASTYRTLLGSGAVFAVRSSQAPDTIWPWQRQGPWWILRYDPLGPTTGLSEAAYAPVRSWSPGAPIQSRATIFALGIFVAILALAASLLRDRFFITAGVIVAVAASIWIIHVWSKHQPAQRQVESAVAIINRELLQYDHWEYRTAATDGGSVSCDWFVGTAGSARNSFHLAQHPMLTSPEQATRDQLILEVDAAGEPQRFIARLRRGEKLAFLTRSVQSLEGEPTPPSAATDSPMQSLVREAYLAPGVRVMGQGYPRAEDGFPEVYLKPDRETPAIEATGPTTRESTPLRSPSPSPQTVSPDRR